jgi:hypothetical protein
MKRMIPVALLQEFRKAVFSASKAYHPAQRNARLTTGGIALLHGTELSKIRPSKDY